MNIADDSTAIIIGSGGGIGKALKQQLLKENYYRKIICFSKTNEWEEWLSVKEKLALEIKQIVEKNGASFAFPSQSIYVEKK